MLDSLRQLAFRHRRWLAGLYLALLLLLSGGLWAYTKWVPDDVDTGLAVATRAFFYRRTFSEVEVARAELAAGDSASVATAQTRLVRFLGEHEDVQPATLWTHAVIDAGILLADAEAKERKGKRGAEALEPLLSKLPLDYRLWWAKGRALEADAEYGDAVKALREAFKLTLHHPAVLEDYLACAGELNLFADIAWAADEFERACVRGAPHGLIKVGIPRSKLERVMLAAVDIPVEHGRFFRHDERWGMARGNGCKLCLPPEMFEPWPWKKAELVVQLRLENVWDGFTIDGLELTRRDGRVESSVPKVAYLHRPGSGVAAYAELFVGVPGQEVRSLTLTYSCAEPKLSSKAIRIIEKARRNLAPAEGG